MLQTKTVIKFVAERFPSDDPDVASMRLGLSNLSTAIRAYEGVKETSRLIQHQQTLMEALGEACAYGDFGLQVASAGVENLASHTIENPFCAEARSLLEKSRAVLLEQGGRVPEARPTIAPVSASDVYTDIKNFTSSTQGLALMRTLKEQELALIVEPSIRVDRGLAALGLTSRGFRVFTSLDAGASFKMAGLMQRYRIGDFCEKLAEIGLSKNHISGHLGLCLSIS